MSESFAELLEESLANQQIKQGSILTALVVDVNSDVVIVHAGLKSEAVIPVDQFFNEQGEIEVQVGDKVEVEQESELWMITKLFDRKNHILRKSVNLSKQTHVIAANIDQAILMITLDSPITTTGFIDRFLVSANAYGVKVVLLFNKLDIYDDLLLQKMAIESNCLIKYCMNQDSLVDSYAPLKFSEFMKHEWYHKDSTKFFTWRNMTT